MSGSGGVYKTNTGEIKSFYTSQDEFKKTFSQQFQETWDVIFAVSGDSVDGVQAIIQAVHDLSQQGLYAVSSLALPLGSHYVYGYFDEGCLSADQAFYVGKGKVGQAQSNNSTTGRWTEHVRKALQGEDNQKAHKIRQWIKANQIALQPTLARNAAADHLVRMLQSFDGPHSEAQAFYAEYFLISHLLGVYNVANETRGNSQYQGYNAIVRPWHLTQENPCHQAIWEKTVATFTENPEEKELSHTWRPALTALFAVDYADALTERLKPLGVEPHDMRGQGRLSLNDMPRHQIQVTGASDPTLTYVQPGKPYRFELRFGVTECLVGMSLRPLSNAKDHIRAFLTFLDTARISKCECFGSHTKEEALPTLYPEQYVMNRRNWPFYKPYAPDANGRASAWFDIKDRDAKTTGTTNWMQGEYHLSLLEAIQMVVKGF